MLFLKNLNNKFQKRLIRPLYAQTQATPYAATLHPGLRDADGSIVPPDNGDSIAGYTYTADTYKFQGGLIPGTVMVKGPGETVLPANGANTAQEPFGLFANYAGGIIDDVRGENSVGVWRGPDAVFELLAPAFNDTGLASAYAAATPGVPVKLYAGTDGRLTSTSPGSNAVVVAHLIERVSASRIVVDLKV